MASQYMFALLLAVTLCSLSPLMASSRYDDAPPCEEDPFIWRNNNRTCPPRAVCADVFDTVRNWYGYRGRTICREHRVLHNCMCENERGVSPCPTDSDDHRLFASRNHKQYTCEPSCNLPYCGNLNARRTQQANEFRDHDIDSAIRMFQFDPDFGGRSYYKVDCRCPRHHFPSTARGVHRAIYAQNAQLSARTHNYIHYYVCLSRGAERNFGDPCRP